MTYEQDLANEQANIAALRSQLKSVRLPSRTINWQHRNVGSPVNTIQNRLEVKRQKLKINNRIKASNDKIISLRSLIFGDGRL